MSLSTAEIARLSKKLVNAEDNRKPINALTDEHPEITIPEAYAIQLRTIETRVKNGARIVGKKIGLTSKAMQDFLKVREPDYGQILDTAVFMEGQPLPMSRLIQPRMESEICFLLNRDLKGPGVTVADVLSASAGVMAAFEVVDSRIKDWKIKIQDSIADSAGCAFIVLGGKLTPVSNLDLRLMGLVLEKDGEIIATAAGAAVLGNPMQAVAWLANALGQYGVSLHAGDLIMSGSLTAAFPVQAGNSFRATFDHLGSVSARFAD